MRLFKVINIFVSCWWYHASYLCKSFFYDLFHIYLYPHLSTLKAVLYIPKDILIMPEYFYMYASLFENIFRILGMHHVHTYFQELVFSSVVKYSHLYVWASFCSGILRQNSLTAFQLFSNTIFPKTTYNNRRIIFSIWYTIRYTIPLYLINV